MTAKQVHMVLVGIIVLLCAGLIGGAYGINSLLTSRAEKLVALKAKSQALEQEQISLKKAKKDIVKYDKLDKIARAVVPEDKNQAEMVREIVNIAAAHNVSLSAINFPASTLGTGAKAPTSSSSAAVTAPRPSAVDSKSSALSQLLPVTNIPGIYLLQVTVISDTSRPVQYDKFIDFLTALEHNRRTAQVANITLAPDPKDTEFLTFTLNLNGYIKP